MHTKNTSRSSRRSFLKKSAVTLPATVLGMSVFDPEQSLAVGGMVSVTVGSAEWMACVGTGSAPGVGQCVQDGYMSTGSPRYIVVCRNFSTNALNRECSVCLRGSNAYNCVYA
jgi:anaerobic selenocysteine-containing dehydrogenase